MKYLIDTNTGIAFLKNNHDVVEKLRVIGIENLWLCSVVKAALCFGAFNSDRVVKPHIFM